MRGVARVALFPVSLALALGAGALALARGASPLVVLAAINAAVIAVVVAAERWIPYEPSWNRDHDGDTRTDLAHGVVSNLLLPEAYQHLLRFSFVPVAAALASKVGGGLWPRHWPLAAQLALSATVAELAQYWAHRGAHETRLLWRLHVVHHSPRRLYWLNAGRDHPLGLLLLFGAEQIPLILLGIDERALAMQVLLTVVVGLFQHANIDLRAGFLNRIFSLAELHRWHHVRSPDHRCNYGSNLAVWDVVFRTWRLPSKALGPLGVDEPVPGRYVPQLLVPFRLRPR